MAVDAFCVLAGGGAKALAFTGALEASAKNGVTFHGYAGCSGGAIVACLAAAGFTPLEIRDRFTAEFQINSVLGDTRELDAAEAALKSLGAAVGGGRVRPVKLLRTWRQSKSTRRKVIDDLGLYDARLLHDRLVKILSERVKGSDSISFGQWKESGLVDLRVIASGIETQQAVLFGRGATLDVPVLSAVVASACYPVVFRPHQVNRESYVDGGLASNVPVFAFVDGSHAKRRPTIAFDLIVGRSPPLANPFSTFARDLVSTALSASDQLLQDVVEQGVVIPIAVPADLSTFTRSVSEAGIEAAWNAGYTSAATFFATWGPTTLSRIAGDELTKQLQAKYALPNLVKPVLLGVKLWAERETSARDVRVVVMVDTPTGARRVIYSVGAENDGDSDLELPADAGLSAVVVKTGQPGLADLQDARDDPEAWKMTRAQTRRIPDDRRAILAVPVRAWPPGQAGRVLDDAKNHPIIATLAIDTTSSLTDSGWLDTAGDQPDRAVAIALLEWAEVLAKVFE